MTSMRRRFEGLKKSRASSRNALKHGLAAAKWAAHNKERIATLTELFKEGRSGTRIEQAARRAAEAREYLERVIAARDEAIAVPCDSSDEKAEGVDSVMSEELSACSTNLDPFERYERRATVQWERALAELELALLED